jgi:hypothetical protein
MAGALGERPSGGPGATRGGGASPPEDDTAGGGRDARANAAQEARPSQPEPARVLGATRYSGAGPSGAGGDTDSFGGQ